MKKFDISFGELNTIDILEIVSGVAGVILGLGLIKDVTDDLAWRQGRDQTLQYLNDMNQYDTTDVNEIKRRAKVYSAKQFLSAQKETVD